MMYRPIKRRFELKDVSFKDWVEAFKKSRNIETADQLNYSLTQLADAHSMLNLNATAIALADIIEQQQSVVIVGDFDADGATSTALLMLALKAFGLKRINYQIPNRFEYGYGLSEKIVEEVARQFKPDWIITVDNGIANIAGVAKANELGIKTIITDHHLPPEKLPEANFIVNPNQKGCLFPSKNLAGVGVAFYLLIGLRQVLRDRNYFQNIDEPNLGQWLDLVALGTVADVVKLDHNNRILVHQGLQRIKAGQCRPGIIEILKVAKREVQHLAASDLGFAVGPRLNAAGRLDDMSLGIECLISENIMQLRLMAEELNDLNQSRREIEQGMVFEAMQKLLPLLQSADYSRPSACCFYENSWHQGVVGLVASRVKEHINRPVIAFAPAEDGTLKGSGRSVAGIHLRDVLADISTKYPHLLQKFGGHAMAAGLSINSEDYVEFEHVFISMVEDYLSRHDVIDEIVTDGTLKPEWISIETVNTLAEIGPFGQGFAEPLFDGEFNIQQARVVGQKHIKFVLEDEWGQGMYDAICFFAPDDVLSLTSGRVELVYKLDINRFRGNESVQLIIEQIKVV